MEEAKQEKIVFINYCDKIDQERVSAIMAIFAAVIEQHKPDVIYFIISSPGGAVEPGIALYNYLKSLPVRLITHNNGSIDSIANVIFVAGKERYASPHSTFLFHGVKFDFSTPASLNASQLAELSDIVEKSHGKIANILCENSEVEKELIEKLFSTGEVKGTQFAIDKKLINEVKPLQIPKDAIIISINFNR